MENFKIDEIKDEEETKQPEQPKPITPSNILGQMIKEYLKLRDMRLDLDATVKQLKEKENLMEEALWDTMLALGFTSVKTQSDGLISRSFNRIFTIADFRIFRAWVEDENQYGLVRQEAHKRNLRDFITKRLKEGIEDAVPPGIEMHINKIIHVKGRGRGDSEDE